jgi:hypothetical protein
MEIRTVEVRCINVEANDGSGCAQFDYAPEEG